MGYTPKEKQKIVDYIIKRRAHHRIKSDTLYAEMVQDDILPQRTLRSLQTVFKNHIINNIAKFCNSEQCRIFERNWNKTKRKKDWEKVENEKLDKDDEDEEVVELGRTRNLNSWLIKKPRLPDPSSRQNGIQRSAVLPHTQVTQSISMPSSSQRQTNIQVNNQKSQLTVSSSTSTAVATQKLRPVPMKLVHRKMHVNEEEEKEDDESDSQWLSAKPEVCLHPEIAPNIERYSLHEDKALVEFLSRKVRNIQHLKHESFWSDLDRWKPLLGRSWKSLRSRYEELKKAKNLDLTLHISPLILKKLNLPCSTTYEPSTPSWTQPLKLTRNEQSIGQQPKPPPSYHLSQDEDLANLLAEAEDEPILVDHHYNTRAILSQRKLVTKPQRPISPVYLGSMPKDQCLSPPKNSQKQQISQSNVMPSQSDQALSFRSNSENSFHDFTVNRQSTRQINESYRDYLRENIGKIMRKEQDELEHNREETINQKVFRKLPVLNSIVRDDKNDNLMTPNSIPTVHSPEETEDRILNKSAVTRYKTTEQHQMIPATSYPEPPKTPPHLICDVKPAGSIMTEFSHVTDFRNVVFRSKPALKKMAEMMMERFTVTESESDSSDDAVDDDECNEPHKKIQQNLRNGQESLMVNSKPVEAQFKSNYVFDSAQDNISSTSTVLYTSDRVAPLDPGKTCVSFHNNKPNLYKCLEHPATPLAQVSKGMDTPDILDPESPLPESISMHAEHEASCNRLVIPESTMADSDSSCDSVSQTTSKKKITTHVGGNFKRTILSANQTCVTATKLDEVASKSVSVNHRLSSKVCTFANCRKHVPSTNILNHSSCQNVKQTSVPLNSSSVHQSCVHPVPLNSAMLPNNILAQLPIQDNPMPQVVYVIQQEHCTHCGHQKNESPHKKNKVKKRKFEHKSVRVTKTRKKIAKWIVTDVEFDDNETSFASSSSSSAKCRRSPRLSKSAISYELHRLTSKGSFVKNK